MSLFVINRYEGESKEEVKNENNHLSELLKKIDERKRQRAAISNKSTVKDVDNNCLEGPEKKRKKNKNSSDVPVIKETDKPDVNDRNEENVCEKTSEQSSEVAEASTKRQKRKKIIKKREHSATEHLVEDNQEVEKKENVENGSEGDDKKNTTEEKASPQSNFIVLGAKSKKKQRAVKRVLPDWLAHPELIPAYLNSGPRLEELDSVLDPKLTEVLRANNIDKLFPVQSSVINWLHGCDKDRKVGWWSRDICVSAPTGSGKTLAYVLPIVQQLQARLVPKIRCLVVLPVKELAAQIYKVMTTYTSHTDLKVGLLSGVSSFEQEQSSIIKRTERGRYLSTVDIVITTPGRLVDHILRTPGFCLNSLRFLVIDEADRATEWLQYLPEPHSRSPILTLDNMRSSKIVPAQKLLFSATLSQDPEKLRRLSLFQPILFTTMVTDKDADVNLDKVASDFVGRYTSPSELTELAVECISEHKPVALYRLLTRHGAIPKTLVFTNSGNTTHRLALLIRSLLSKRNVTIGELSAQLAPKRREGILGRFASGEIRVLISSDALARGVDIPGVELVVSYDIPKHIKGYIHRAGRTGRAGKPGTAVSVLTANQVGIFKQMLSAASKSPPDIERMELNAAAGAVNYCDHVEKLRGILETEQNESLERAKALKRRRATNVHRQNGNKE